METALKYSAVTLNHNLMEQKIIINIGRQFGSGGKRVAEALSRKLGIPVYDNEIITEAATQSGFSPELFKRSDEKKSAFSIGGIFGSNRYGSYTTNVLSDSELFKIQSDVIRDIASKGSAIFVGRACDYVLREMDCCIDVFLTAPLEERKKLVSEREGITIEEAESMISKREKARQDFYNFFTFGNWGVASNYDLCIDTTLIGVEQTADLIIDFGKKRGLIR